MIGKPLLIVGYIAGEFWVAEEEGAGCGTSVM
jgi:hypothetical protein